MAQYGIGYAVRMKDNANKVLTRAEIIQGFHKVYLANIAEETALRKRVGALRGGGIPMDRLKEIFNESVADYVEGLLAKS
jgi:hypothetical protein